MSQVVLKVENDISTDIIYPGRFMATVLPTETPQYAFADYSDFNAQLNEGKIPQGAVIIAGKNFGCGSSREQAASCLKGYDFVVIAKDFARIFLQNGINLGLNMVICPTIEAEEGDEVGIEGGKVVNKSQNKSFEIIPMAPAQQTIIDAGGLIPYARKRMLDRASKA
jgi:3-isopropylmalate/(R)-2-methylmalate dehydratase small subunit